MTPLGNLTTASRRAPALALALIIALAGASPASAGDASAEHEQLAALARQLDLIDRLAEHAASTAPQERARYHFDYARLRADLKRVRAGLQDYLVPQRAQPRDPVPLAGDYVRRDRADDEEPSP
ncbi:RAQPRD family integrative conjugative element protein [Xanthomonas euvesicatoria pv. euvesicatoria]|uniref:integrative conjugative element protein, RAQPRD family n=1 Tax=Xanthomonas TaxID=338 RepID=UPI0020C97536|nr:MULTISPECIES: RAQPRD family integrative conjugative element protein [Xanthomonas]MDW7724584.1 RAQPRD family integrative conjugative element protein [Xanthomonas euvesicatoria]MEB1027092.1 RAQPRD family integrative conjugative element protein [Xanthomonas campestris pv. campestris]